MQSQRNQGFLQSDELKATASMSKREKLQLVADCLKSIFDNQDWKVEEESVALDIPATERNLGKKAHYRQIFRDTINTKLRNAQKKVRQPAQLNAWGCLDISRNNKYLIAYSDTDSFRLILAFANYWKESVPQQKLDARSISAPSKSIISPAIELPPSIHNESPPLLASAEANASLQPIASPKTSNAQQTNSESPLSIASSQEKAVLQSVVLPKTSSAQQDLSLGISGLSVKKEVPVAISEPKVNLKETLLKNEATQLAIFISDHRCGNSARAKVVKSPQDIKVEINKAVSALLLQEPRSDNFHRAVLTLKLLEATYEEIYKGVNGKSYYFTRKNNAYFLFFLNKNTSTSHAERSGTEQKHIKLLQEVYEANFKAVTKSASKDYMETVKTLSQSKLMQFQTSYYARYAKGIAKPAEKVNNLFSSFKPK